MLFLNWAKRIKMIDFRQAILDGAPPSQAVIDKERLSKQSEKDSIAVRTWWMMVVFIVLSIVAIWSLQRSAIAVDVDLSHLSLGLLLMLSAYSAGSEKMTRSGGEGSISS